MFNNILWKETRLELLGIIFSFSKSTGSSPFLTLLAKYIYCLMYYSTAEWDYWYKKLVDIYFLVLAMSQQNIIVGDSRSPWKFTTSMEMWISDVFELIQLEIYTQYEGLFKYFFDKAFETWSEFFWRH